MSSENNIPNINISRLNEIQFKKYVIEAIVLLVLFAWNVSNVVFQDQIIIQACVSELGYNISDCLTLGTNNQSNKVQDLEIVVQPYVANLMMAKLLVETMIPAFLSFFIGAWSDKFGRKPMIVASIAGFFITCLVTTILCAMSRFFSINPWYNILASIPVAVTGGMCTFSTGVFCYVADITTSENRAAKMSGVEAMLYIGLLLGSLTTSYIYQYTSSAFVFGLSCATSLISLIYAIFYIEERKCLKNSSFLFKAKELFKFHLIRDMFETCCKQRPHHGKEITWIVMLSLAFSIAIQVGNQIVLFLFVRAKFNWTVKDFGLYDASNTISLIIANLLITNGLQKFLKLSDTALALIGYLSALVNSIVLIIATESWHLYFSIALTFFKGIISPVCRSILATVFAHSDKSRNEVGKVYTLTTSLESIMLVGAVFIYPLVYKSTIDQFPETFNVISAIIYSGIVIAMIFVYCLRQQNDEVEYYEIR